MRASGSKSVQTYITLRSVFTHNHNYSEFSFSFNKITFEKKITVLYKHDFDIIWYKLGLILLQ